MPKAVQMPGIAAAAVDAASQRHAAAAGTGVPDPLHRETARLAARPTVEEWLARTRRRNSTTSRAQTIAALDEMRGPWPDARR